MKRRIDFEDPRPRARPESEPSLSWSVIRVFNCPPIAVPTETSFREVLDRRRSIRTINVASLREIVNLVAFATSPRDVKVNDEFNRSRRLSPSAGALHAIDVLMLDSRLGKRAFRYNPFRHQLELLRILVSEQLEKLFQDARDMLPDARGTLLVLAGNPSRIDAAYESSISLLWRDAGALLQTIALAAIAFRLAQCPLGKLGDEAIRSLGMDQLIVPCGIILVGKDSSV